MVIYPLTGVAALLTRLALAEPRQSSASLEPQRMTITKQMVFVYIYLYKAFHGGRRLQLIELMTDLTQ